MGGLRWLSAPEENRQSPTPLAAEGFSDSILEAVVALTKFPGETRMAAAARAAGNAIARHQPNFRTNRERFCTPERTCAGARIAAGRE